MVNLMKWITLGCALSLMWACGPKPVVVTEPMPVQAGDKLYSEAEKLYQAEAYTEALKQFEAYIDSYPNGPFAAAALMKIGAIYTENGEYEAARRSYKRVIDAFSKSPFSQDARVALLNVDFKDQKYDTVIDNASQLLEDVKDKTAVARIYLILGDTYLALEAPEDAIFFYSRALKEVDVPITPEVSLKLNQAISMLDAIAIEDLLEQVQEPVARSYMMYRLGQLYDEEHRYDEGVKLMSEFLDNYPDHEYAEAAMALMEEMAEKMDYARTTVGCLLPLSGRYKIYGFRALKGIEFALGQLLQRKDVPIHLIIKDTGSNPEQAAAAAEELVRERVAFIIGPIVTAESAAVIAQDAGIPIITITQKENIIELGDYVFRNFLTPQMQVRSIVGYATERLGLSDFAILYPDERYGRTFMDLFWDEVINQGGRVVGLESYDPTHTDFAAPIKKLVGIYYDVPEDLKEEEPEEEEADTEEETSARGRKEEDEPKAIVDFEAVFIPDSPAKAGLIIPQLAFYDVEDVYLLGTNLWHSKKMIDMAKDFVQGAILTDAFFSDSRSGRVRKFVNQFEDVYGDKPGFLEATTYDTARIVFDLILREDIRSRNALKNQLLDMRPFPGVTGNTSFDEQGDVQKDVSLLRIKGERFVELNR